MFFLNSGIVIYIKHYTVFCRWNIVFRSSHYGTTFVTSRCFPSRRCSSIGNTLPHLTTSLGDIEGKAKNGLNYHYFLCNKALPTGASLLRITIRVIICKHNATTITICPKTQCPHTARRVIVNNENNLTQPFLCYKFWAQYFFGFRKIVI